MGYYQFTCTGPLTLHALGTYTYRVLFCDPELEAALPFKKGTPRLRIDGELEGIPVSLAWQPSRGGPHYVMVSPELCKQAGVKVGDEVTLRFNLADPNRVPLPEELEQLLRESGEGTALWEAQTPGRRRSLMHLVESAKSPATRARRAAEALALLRSGEPLLKKTRQTKPGARRAAVVLERLAPRRR